MMLGFELCYVSAETAWPHALEPCTALWPDKQISFLGDAINLDFISRSAAKEPRERECLGKTHSFPSFSTFSVFREVLQPGM